MRRVQIAIVGGGPAGLAAASAAASTGAEVVVFDERPAPGGRLAHRRADVTDFDGKPVPAHLLAAQLASAATAAGATIESRTVVWGAFAGGQLGVVSAAGSVLVEAERIVLATGATDRPLAFPGSTLPGVMTASGMQQLLNRHGLRPGGAFVVIGDGPEAREVATDLRNAGAEIIEVSSFSEVEARGDSGVEQAIVDGLDYDVDGIVVAAGRIPDPALAVALEADVQFDRDFGVWVPSADREQRSSVPLVWVCGDVTTTAGAEEAMAQGRRAGVSAAASLTSGSDAWIDAAAAFGDQAQRLAHHSWRRMVSA